MKKYLIQNLYKYRTDKEYSLLNLKKGNHDLIIYCLINLDQNENRSYSILDTLMIKSKNAEKVSIGYCEIDKENQNAGNIIALIEVIDIKKCSSKILRRPGEQILKPKKLKF